MENINLNGEIKYDILVSIIVPVYNSEQFLSRCLNSLCNQTLKNIEIICINDGSIDNSLQILTDFKKKDSRVVVLTQENKKQGAARNAGMRITKGEYIGFIDSDDWVDLNYFEKLYKSAKKYNSDIALATNVRIGNGKTKKRLQILEEKFVSNLQEKIDIGNQAKNPCPTNKIYRKEMLAKNLISWPEGVFCEDKIFTIQAIYYANGIVCVPNIYYYYFRNPNSTVNNKNKKHIKKNLIDKEKAKRDVLDFLISKNAQIRDKEFWATESKIAFFNIVLWKINQSINTKRFYLFGFIRIFEYKYN